MNKFAQVIFWTNIMSESYVTAVHIVRVLFAVFLMPCSISTIFLVQCPIVFVLYLWCNALQYFYNISSAMSCSRRKMQSSALVSAQSSPRHRFLNGTQKNPISSSFSLPSISPSLVTKILVFLPEEPQFTVFVANGKKI